MATSQEDFELNDERDEYDDAQTKDIRRIVVRELSNCNQQLSDALYNSLPTFSSLMLEHEFITNHVHQKNQKFDAIMHDFKARLSWLNLDELRDHCIKFLSTLTEVGGPAVKAAERLKKNWNTKINKRHTITFLPITLQEKSQSLSADSGQYLTPATIATGYNDVGTTANTLSSVPEDSPLEFPIPLSTHHQEVNRLSITSIQGIYNHGYSDPYLLDERSSSQVLSNPEPEEDTLIISKKPTETTNTAIIICGSEQDMSHPYSNFGLAQVCIEGEEQKSIYVLPTNTPDVSRPTQLIEGMEKNNPTLVYPNQLSGEIQYEGDNASSCTFNSDTESALLAGPEEISNDLSRLSQLEIQMKTLSKSITENEQRLHEEILERGRRLSVQESELETQRKLLSIQSKRSDDRDKLLSEREESCTEKLKLMEKLLTDLKKMCKEREQRLHNVEVKLQEKIDQFGEELETRVYNLKKREVTECNAPQKNGDLDDQSTTKPMSSKSYRLTTEEELQHKETRHDEMSTFKEMTKKSTLLSTDETTRVIISILFSFLLCLPYMGKQTLPSPLTGVEVLASTRLLVAGGQLTQLNWEEYGLILDIPDNALPPGFIAEIIIHVSVSGPYVYPDSESWKLASAVYWISSSKDFINPVQLGLWHSAKGLQNGSNLCIVTAQDEVQNGRHYIFEDVSEVHTVDGSFVYCYINHFSNFAVLSEIDQYFDGCLLYQESPKSAVTWEYSFVVYKSHPDGIIERLLDKASYTGWTIDIIESGVKFKNNNSLLTLSVKHNLKEWEIIAKNPPLTYEKDEILRHQSICSNMQFFLHWAGQGPPTTQFVKLSLVGAKKPTSITFETNSGHDKEGNKVRGASGGIISSTEELLLCSRDVHQVLLLCQYLDIELPDCKKIERENHNLEEQKVNVFGIWLDKGERTWRDFIRALAKLSQCVVAKELAKKHNVYYFNSDIALEMCKDLNNY